ncbi:hypothetical protein C1E23_09635 [Pseudoalteromonas phenolica]|uniref:DM13 domain-containing protein n=1 Tax=Pseudoalteromonas phenolica TaxID=161398 RepID=A0A4Q7IP41_9GAMM|nr:DM13 domain-containing protein [Pseudoalteromonas phenolica]RZQ53329.1 hypothetical protein C1E23_09635 [Pseudoalteromonas phenolica]
MKAIKLIFSAVLIFSFGFSMGIYTLPLMVAPPSLSMLELATAAQSAKYLVQIPDELDGSDLLHYGKGEFYISESKIVFKGKLAPGPDYQLYLSKQFVENESQFNEHKDSMLNISEVKRFDGFISVVPNDVDINQFNSVIIWCEAFGEFITAAKFKS